MDFTDLLELILKETAGILWIRFLTSHPKDFSPKLINAIANNSRLCRHIHLPVQHGSDNILKKMNRQYTVTSYMNLIHDIKKRITDIALTSDILIGFPGETDRDFQETLTLMKEIEFDDAFMYRYSVREGTKAAEMEDNVPEKLKLERLAEVIELQQQIGLKKKEKKIGKNVTILVENKAKKGHNELLGRTEQDEMVVFPGDLSEIGTFVRMTLESLQGNTFKGRKS
jgi:tRNA-2-methylthio-N6-dimethylallyladenosine synthase